MSLLGKIHWTPLQPDQYLREETEKSQIYIHHTAGGPDPYSVVNWWNSTPDRVGTHFIIGGTPFRSNSNWKDGDIIQCFNTKYWAYHLGLRSSHLRKALNPKSSRWLNSNSVTIEICNWGPLNFDFNDNRYETVDHGYFVDDSKVVTYDTPYRGYKFYQRYTDAQLISLRDILIYTCDKFDIPRGFKGMEMFDINKRALEGEPGIWTHTSVRPDKSDCHPQPELIDMLRSL